MKTEIPAFPVILFNPSTKKFVLYDPEGIIGHELADKPEEATIWPLIGDEETSREQILGVIEELEEEFGEVIPLHVSIKVETPLP